MLSPWSSRVPSRPSRVRRVVPLFAVWLALLAASLPAAMPVLAATHTFTSTADTYTNSDRRTSNYGTQTTVRVRASSTTHRAYLRFDVAGLDGPVTSARLRLFVTDAAPNGGTIHRSASGWTETGLNWNNAPALDPAVTGGDAFDLAELGLAEARFVRVRDVSETGAPPTAGFDLDAIGVVNASDLEP